MYFHHHQQQNPSSVRLQNTHAGIPCYCCVGLMESPLKQSLRELPHWVPVGLSSGSQPDPQHPLPQEHMWRWRWQQGVSDQLHIFHTAQDAGQFREHERGHTVLLKDTHERRQEDIMIFFFLKSFSCEKQKRTGHSRFNMQHLS